MQEPCWRANVQASEVTLTGSTHVVPSLAAHVQIPLEASMRPQASSFTSRCRQTLAIFSARIDACTLSMLVGAITTQLPG